MSREEGAAFARSKAMVFIECSAKTKLGIQQAFEELVTKVNFACNLLYPQYTPEGYVWLAISLRERERESGDFCVCVCEREREREREEDKRGRRC